jgi:hypothetical protein
MSSVLAAAVPDVTKRNRYPLDIKPDRSCRSLDISELRMTTAGSVRTWR